MAAGACPTPKLLTILLAGAALTACASEPAPAPPPLAAAEPAPDPGASPYGLFLAGHAARDAGQLGAAAAYLGRAAATSGEPSYVRIEAFEATLRAGDVSGAAALAPAPDDPSLGARRLGVLVRGVEAMAVGKNKDAYALLSGPDVGFPHKAIAGLLAPFAAAGAGDAAHALARPDLAGDGIAQFVADLDQAQLDERLGKASPTPTPPTRPCSRRAMRAALSRSPTAPSWSGGAAGPRPRSSTATASAARPTIRSSPRR